MYRIHFDPGTSMFVVQFLVWGVFWKTCKAGIKVVDDTPLGIPRPLWFETYADACKWVSDKGIPEAYEVQPPKKSVYTRFSAA